MREKSENNRSEEPCEEVELPLIPYDEQIFPSSLFGYQTAIRLAANMDALDIVRNYESLESYCDASQESFNMSYAFDVDLSIDEALHQPRKIALRVPIYCGKVQCITSVVLKKTWCRQLSHYFEWAAGVPELGFLSEMDKIRLITRQVCRVVCFSMAYKTFENGMSEGMIFGSGAYYSPTEPCDPIIQPYVHNLSRTVQDLIVSNMRRLRLSHHEYLLIKLLLLFTHTHDIRISDEGRDIISGALRKYSAALFEQCMQTTNDVCEHTVRQRIKDLLVVLSDMDVVGEVDAYYLKDLALKNNSNFQGRLTESVHVHALGD